MVEAAFGPAIVDESPRSIGIEKNPRYDGGILWNNL
jgi:hypothetical protein